MKKVLLGLCLFATSTIVAQDLKSVKKAYDAKEFEKAQQAVDAFVAKDEKKAEAWYWKHKVYNAIATSEQYKTLVPDAKWKGFEAFKKYLGMDKTQVSLLTDNILDFGASILNDYRSSFITIGGGQLDLKTQEGYTQSFENLKKALTVFDFMYQQKAVGYSLDTLITFYAGYAAMNAKNDENTEIYYKKIADANAFGTDYKIAYGWLANYYLTDKKDLDKAKPVIEKGIKHYPDDEYLKSLKSKSIAATGDIKAIFANHEENIAKPEAQYNDYLNYAAELFDYLYNDSSVKTDFVEKEKRFEEVMGKGLSIKPNSAEGNFLMGMNTTQKTIEIDKQIKLLKNKKTPADIEAVKKLNADKMVLADAAIKNFELVSSLYRSKGTNLKDVEKERYRTVLTNMVYFYYFKKMDTRAKELEETLKSIK